MDGIKTFGIRKYINSKKNKMNGKKGRWRDVKLLYNVNRPIRTCNKSQLNSFVNKGIVDDFVMCTYTTKRTLTFASNRPSNVRTFSNYYVGC